MPDKISKHLIDTYAKWPIDKLFNELRESRDDYTEGAVYAMELELVNRGYDMEEIELLRPIEPKPSNSVELSKGTSSLVMGMFSEITSRKHAVKVTRGCAGAFYMIAAIQGLIGYFIVPEMIFSGVVWAFFSSLLLMFKSRIVSIILVLLAADFAVAMVLNSLDPDSVGGGGGIWMAVFILLVAGRALLATISLNGKFKEIKD